MHVVLLATWDSDSFDAQHDSFLVYLGFILVLFYLFTWVVGQRLLGWMHLSG